MFAAVAIIYCAHSSRGGDVAFSGKSLRKKVRGVEEKGIPANSLWRSIRQPADSSYANIEKYTYLQSLALYYEKYLL